MVINVVQLLKKLKNGLMIIKLFINIKTLVEKPPKQQDLLKWLTDFQDRGLRYFFNTSGQVYRQMHLKDQINKMTLEEAAKLLSQNGKLIKRPLVTDGKKLTCGFKEDIYEKTWL